MHRDVKPDNIILADDDAASPWLLDFGLNHHRIEGVAFKTEHWEEVSNRFLRLPELSAGSPFKQDPRSDLSFVAGIVFYMLTGQSPDVLQDAEGRLPHQRNDNHARIRSAAGPGLARLLSLFDIAFAPQIADRFTTADVMLERMEGVMKPRVAGRSEEDIRETMDTKAARWRADTYARLGEALQQIQRVHEETGKVLGVPLNQRRSNKEISGTSGRYTFAWVEPGSKDAVLSVQCEVRETGDEIEISLSGEPVIRTSTAAPRYDESLFVKLKYGSP
ncbi:MAG: protein kinase, partial [Alphaproteobacteria bacterium]|nr:protein kinase [Alphaproteobacteria bacterium]